MTLKIEARSQKVNQLKVLAMLTECRNLKALPQNYRNIALKKLMLKHRKSETLTDKLLHKSLLTELNQNRETNLSFFP